MKKLFLFMLVASLGIVGQAQEKEKVLEKPKDIKVQEFDEFKNSSFNIYDKSLHYKKMADGEEDLTAEDLIGAKKLSSDVKTLSKKAEALMDKAKNVSPKTKSPAAVKSTKKSVEALKEAQKNLEYILEKMGAAE
jgi:phosphate starvation-inducible protein PhoH